MCSSHASTGRTAAAGSSGRGPTPSAYARLNAQVELVASELRKRVGQTFTLEELAAAYDRAEDWARDLLHDARDEDAPPPETTTITDAAFHRYARGARDYVP